MRVSIQISKLSRHPGLLLSDLSIPILLILILTVLYGQPATAQGTNENRPDPQMLFNEGNFYFQEHNYRLALDRYKQIEDMGLRSGPLFLNMGLSHKQLEEYGYALYYFNSAARFAEVRASAREGAEFISERLFQRYGQIPVLNTWSWRFYLLFNAGYVPFLAVSLILFNICLLGWAAQWFYPAWRTRIRYAVLFAFLALIPFSASAWWLWSVNDRYEAGMIVHDSISLRESAGTQSTVLLQLTPGFRFIKDHETSKLHPGYLNVQLSNGMSGWVPAESARIFQTH